VDTAVFIFNELMAVVCMGSVAKALFTGEVVPLEVPDEPTIFVSRAHEPRRFWIAVLVAVAATLVFGLAAYLCGTSLFRAN